VEAITPIAARSLWQEKGVKEGRTSPPKALPQEMDRPLEEPQTQLMPQQRPPLRVKPQQRPQQPQGGQGGPAAAERAEEGGGGDRPRGGLSRMGRMTASDRAVVIALRATPAVARSTLRPLGAANSNSEGKAGAAGAGAGPLASLASPRGAPSPGGQRQRREPARCSSRRGGGGGEARAGDGMEMAVTELHVMDVDDLDGLFD
jgi:hypothetical protein